MKFTEDVTVPTHPIDTVVSIYRVYQESRQFRIGPQFHKSERISVPIYPVLGYNIQGVSKEVKDFESALDSTNPNGFEFPLIQLLVSIYTVYRKN